MLRSSRDVGSSENRVGERNDRHNLLIKIGFTDMPKSEGGRGGPGDLPPTPTGSDSPVK